MAVKLFDANFYAAANPDLAATGLTTDAQLLSHFQSSGLNEGRDFSPFVNLNFYRSSNSDLASFNNRQAFEHLKKNGVAEGRRFSELVELNFYRASNIDLAGFNNEQIFKHLQRHGVAEGRRFSQFTDLNFYKIDNRDLADLSNIQALRHLQINGLGEGRSFSQFFDINYYRACNPDLVSAGLNSRQLLQHFKTNGLGEGRKFSLAFDVNYYKSVNSDLTAAALNNQQLYDHFQLYGLKEGRVSSPAFNVSFYLANNSDLRAANFNFLQAYDHFVLYGYDEGRFGTIPPTINWTRQLGTSSNDTSSGVAVDSAGNVYLTGSTIGSLAGTNAGGNDAWVAKYDSLGNQHWLQQFGTFGDDFSSGVAVDSASNIYITGSTTGSLAGTNAGGNDAWVAKYDSLGNQHWLQQFGTSGDDFSSGVAVDSASNIYITGSTTGSLAGTNAGGNDAWVAKYDSLGNQHWLQQFGTSGDDFARGVAVDTTSNVYIVANLSSSPLVAKYDSSGNQQWIEQSTSRQSFNTVAVDSSGNIYVAGAGLNRDAFVTKYNSLGNQQWTQEFGIDSSGFLFESGIDLAIDSVNNVSILLRSARPFGVADSSVFKYDPAGYRLGMLYQTGRSFPPRFGEVGIFGIAVDSDNNLYLTGNILSDTNTTGDDVWLGKLS